MGIVTRELRVRAKMLAVKTSWQRFGRPAGMYTELEDRHGIHGGDVETSLMLHFRPDLVDMAKADNFVSNVARAEKEFALLRHTGTHAFAWIASDLNPNGVVGDASIATAEKGRLTAEHQAGRLHQPLAGCAQGEARRLAGVDDQPNSKDHGKKNDVQCKGRQRRACSKASAPRPIASIASIMRPLRSSSASATAISRGLGVADGDSAQRLQPTQSRRASAPALRR